MYPTTCVVWRPCSVRGPFSWAISEPGRHAKARVDTAAKLGPRTYRFWGLVPVVLGARPAFLAGVRRSDMHDLDTAALVDPVLDWRCV